ncbi:argininosuccinate lyase [Aminivibrio sp.]|jgi:argininosuccinate lyase|uniref:argininosuccinate lyase n=1 Tax=Aminivibrio sp. TaxID=1872489 RepID=UPI001A3E01FB|nr:argininosuccinate lyase [Aminivibrio sp.]MBL3538878.1 argininosuccinate lyase [Aminivibrio sp.]
MWKGRFSENTAQAVQKFTQSLDLDWGLASYDIDGSIAHARMLGSVGLIPADEARRIEDGLNRIREEIASGVLVPTQELEDVHMNIESRLIELLGPTGARLHTGRSRNDQVAVTMRLFLRDRLRHLASGMEALLAVLLERAARHREIIVPGFTHLQQAQPISMGHYWMAHFTAFSRDCDRLLFALESLRECPLGAGALAGSTLPLNREMTARELGFAAPTRNSLDTVAQRDYMADYHSFAVTFATHCSRLAEDFVIYSSREFGWLLLPDAFCTGSSMMPQKKNPDVLELLRGKTGQILGHFLDLLVTLKGLPMTYDRDLQEDKRGLQASLKTVEEMLAVLVPLLSAVEVDGEKAAEGMNDGFLLATDVAEYLVAKGVPFRQAHGMVGGLVKECIARKKGLFDLTRDEWKKLLPEAGEDLLPLLSLRSAVERRNTYGGTAFGQVAKQIEDGKAFLENFRESVKR